MSASTASATARLAYIDALRGFAIVLVVIGHALQYGIPEPDNNPLFRFIYAFHMPLFMFVSGFVYSGFGRKIKAELRLKSLSLLVPFIAWLPVTLLWTELGPTPIGAGRFLANVIASPDAGGLWFLWVLFLINVIVLAGRTITPRSPLAAAWAMWAILNVVALLRPQSNILGLKLLCWHLPFFLTGISLRRTRLASQLNWALALVSSLTFLVLSAFWVRAGTSPLAVHLAALPSMVQFASLRVFNYAVAFSGILAAFSVFAAICKARSLPWLDRLGRVSLEIYTTHIYFLALTVALVAMWDVPETVRVATIFGGGLAGALLASAAIKKWPPLAVVMFGARNRPTLGVAG